MKRKGKRRLLAGIGFITAFVVWTLLLQWVDVQPIGLKGTKVGFATLNSRIHNFTGVHMTLYTVTDWLGLVPVFVCMIFAGIGMVQLIKRKSLFKVDYDILFLGVYYIIVIVNYLVFEMIPINYRPIFIEGRMEVSYPSSTTLLVLSVMPTLVFQVKQRVENVAVKKIIVVLTYVFSAFMVIGRLLSGVHWATDIVGGIMLSTGCFTVYQAVVLLCSKKED